MTPKLELDEAVPDYLEWLLKNKGLKLEKIEKDDSKIESSEDSMEMIKIHKKKYHKNKVLM